MSRKQQADPSTQDNRMNNGTAVYLCFLWNLILTSTKPRKVIFQAAFFIELPPPPRRRIGNLQQELDNSVAVQTDFVRLSQSLQMELEKIRQSEKEVSQNVYASHCYLNYMIGLNV